MNLMQYKRKYEIVINEMSKNEIDVINNNKIIIIELKNSNPGFSINNLASLWRKASQNPNITHQSIVIFTIDMQEVNNCIKSRFYINYKCYSTEYYIS